MHRRGRERGRSAVDLACQNHSVRVGTLLREAIGGNHDERNGEQSRTQKYQETRAEQAYKGIRGVINVDARALFSSCLLANFRFSVKPSESVSFFMRQSGQQRVRAKKKEGKRNRTCDGKARPQSQPRAAQSRQRQRQWQGLGREALW